MRLRQIMHGQVLTDNYPRHPMVVDAGYVGIEIELEGVRNYRQIQGWNLVPEDSLRDSGYEIVSNGPQAGDYLYNSIERVDEHFTRHEPRGTWRCSTHVHVDMLDMTIPQIKKFIIIAVILEDILFKIGGIHRYHSNFCMPLGLAETLLEVLGTAWYNIEDGGFIFDVVSKWNKYSNINLCPLTSFGTIEFRNAEPKWKQGDLLRLANRVLGMKLLAKTTSMSCTELVAAFDLDLAYKVLSMGLKSSTILYENDLEAGIERAEDILNMKSMNELQSQEVVEILNSERWKLNASFIEHYTEISEGLDILGISKHEAERVGVTYIDLKALCKPLWDFIDLHLLELHSRRRFQNLVNDLSDSQRLAIRGTA